MSTTTEQMRAWRGPALFSFGFRPFFLGATLWAALAMALWMPMMTGALMLPTAFDPVSWHAHELIFGYLTAVVAGFLMTAVPNWTGRLPIVGWPLAGLFALWLLGRLAVALSAGLPAGLVAGLDLAFGVVFTAMITREIVAGRNWRNLIVLAMLGGLVAGNAVFHWEAATGVYAAQGVGARLGIGAGIMMIAVIGGRIVPSFTRNWLVKRGVQQLPAPPMRGFDKLALAGLLAALLTWLVAPQSPLAAAALLLAGALHLGRLGRWCGHRATAEPLLWILHVGYAFVPLGALALGVAILRPDLILPSSAQHLWMIGAIGVMTLAVMTRATLGHTDRPLTAGAGTVAIYLLAILAALSRIVAGVVPAEAALLQSLSGLAWIGAMAGFAVLYGRLLLRPKVWG